MPEINANQKHLFDHYTKHPYYDEMFDQNGKVRTSYKLVYQRFSKVGINELDKRNDYLKSEMIKQGITFTLSGSNQEPNTERVIPFDMIPRIVTRTEWSQLEKGLKQRVQALNQFIHDVYHEQNIFKDNIIPRKMIITNPYFCKEMADVSVSSDVYIPISGIDLIRDDDGEFYVLEDNVRTPSGLSYIYKNRSLMKHLFSELYFHHPVKDIDESLNILLSSLLSLAPQSKENPFVVLLTPGIYNSAYFEHTFLAQEMGIELVEGRDLTVIDQKVFLKSIDGLKQVDVIYRRIDDAFLDPLSFNPNSMLGVPGLMNVYRAGNVAIANAPGTGIADDKAIYAFVPDMIRYYLKEEPILKNVPTYILSNPSDKEFVLEHLPEMVVKERALSGGYGMLIGPTATEEEINAFAEKIKLTPERYIAQPTIKLSSSPSFTNNRIAPCHIDLRAFVFMGKETHVLPGGLTRVALKEGSLVVNSSQGGGTKDTWVLESDLIDDMNNEVKGK